VFNTDLKLGFRRRTLVEKLAALRGNFSVMS